MCICTELKTLTLNARRYEPLIRSLCSFTRESITICLSTGSLWRRHDSSIVLRVETLTFEHPRPHFFKSLAMSGALRVLLLTRILVSRSHSAKISLENILLTSQHNIVWHSARRSCMQNTYAIKETICCVVGLDNATVQPDQRSKNDCASHTHWYVPNNKFISMRIHDSMHMHRVIASA